MKFFAGNRLQIPKGVILLWYGDAEKIPEGFVVCDGNSETPDLRDKFVVGAGNAYVANSNGGSLSHSHGGKSGKIGTVYGGEPVGGGSGNGGVNIMDHSHIIAEETNLSPPYHALYYIMKI